MTNEILTEGLKNRQYQELYTALLLAKEIIDSGKSLSSTNEQLIVAIYNLRNIKELYEKINEIASLEPEKINEYRSEISGYKINASDVEELEDELVTSLNRVFTGFKNGFGFILSANVIIIATAILSYLSVSNSQSMSDVQDTTKVALIVNLLCYIMILVGLVILYNSSELKKSKKY